MDASALFDWLIHVDMVEAWELRAQAKRRLALEAKLSHNTLNVGYWQGQRSDPNAPQCWNCGGVGHKIFEFSTDKAKKPTGDSHRHDIRTVHLCNDCAFNMLNSALPEQNPQLPFRSEDDPRGEDPRRSLYRHAGTMHKIDALGTVNFSFGSGDGPRCHSCGFSSDHYIQFREPPGDEVVSIPVCNACLYEKLANQFPVKSPYPPRAWERDDNDPRGQGEYRDGPRELQRQQLEYHEERQKQNGLQKKAHEGEHHAHDGGGNTLSVSQLFSMGCPECNEWGGGTHPRRCQMCVDGGIEPDPDCADCGGSGKCETCGGHGLIYWLPPQYVGREEDDPRGPHGKYAHGDHEKHWHKNDLTETTCPDCWGDGDCSECEGSAAEPGESCGACDSTGICPTCNGHTVLLIKSPNALDDPRGP